MPGAGRIAQQGGTTIAATRAGTFQKKKASHASSHASHVVQQSCMVLPSQRSEDHGEMRKRIVNFFHYFDRDESGEVSLSELRDLFALTMNVGATKVDSEVFFFPPCLHVFFPFNV